MMHTRVKRWPSRIRRIAAAWAAVLLLCASPAVAQEVDAAAKKLSAANGLYQRGLHKLAAAQYQQFLQDYPQHTQAPTAKHALAVCWFRLGEHAEAIETLKDLLRDERFKQRAEALLILGHSHLSLGSYEEALGAFDGVLSQHADTPHAEPAALTRAQVLYLMGRGTDAAAACEHFLRRYLQSSRRGDALYFLALARHGMGDHQGAVQALEELGGSHPDSRHRLDAVLLTAQCLEALERSDAAGEQYRSFIAQAPAARQAEGLFALGVLEHRRGRYADAVRILSDLLARHAESEHAPGARLQLGLTYVAGRRLDEARRMLLQVVRQDPGRAAAAKYWLAQCDIAEQKFEPALSLLDELATAQPPPANLEEVMLDRGECLMGLGRYKEAAGAFESFVARYAEHEQARGAIYRQAFCLHKLGDHARSLALCERLGGKADDALSQPTAELRAENLFLLQRYKEAARRFEELARAAEGEERGTRFVARQGQSDYFAGDYERAIATLTPLMNEKRVRHNEELAPTLLLLGDALLQTGKHRAAAEVLSEYVPIARKDRPEAQFKLALAQLRSGDEPAAEKMLAAAARGPADSPWVMRSLFEYGQLKYRQKDAARAAEALRKVAGSAPADLAAPADYLLAWIDFDAGRYAEAAQGFGRMAERYPDDALAGDALFHQGVALKEAGSAEKAIDLLQKYLGRHASSLHAVKARQVIAACLVKLERHEEAVKALAALAGDNLTATDEVLYDLAWSQQALKQIGDAEATYGRLLDQHPGSRLAPAARSELAEILFQQERYAGCAQLLEKVVSDASAVPRTVAVALYRLGSTYEKLDKPDKAVEAYRRFLAQHERDELAAWAHYQAGISLVKLDALGEAAAHFDKALNSAPTPELAPLALLKLAETRAQMGAYRESEKLYRLFLDRHPNDRLAYQAQFGVGWALENQKNYDEARGWYEKVIASSNTPSAARAQFQIGEIYFAEGKLEEAVAALLAVADVYAYPEWQARALFEAGRVFERMSQPEQAVGQYEQVVRRFKEAPEAALAAKRLQAIQR